MTKGAKAYLSVVILCGMTVMISCVLSFGRDLMAGENPTGLLQNFLVLLGLCILCRTMPIYISEDGALDISFISILSSVAILGPVYTVALVALSTPFVVECGRRKGDPVRHIFNVPVEKTLFNLSNWTLSIFLPGLVYTKLGGVPGQVIFPDVLLPLAVFVLLSLPLNALLLVVLLNFGSGKPLLPELGKVLVLLLPNMLAVTPIGLLMAYLLSMTNGPYLAVLFLAPLLLARYAFKLYLDSKQEQYILIQTLIATVEAKDKYTEGHSKRVSVYAEEIARAMKLSNTRLDHIRIAALLHDIGKIGIGDAILNKPGALTPEERQRIMDHPSIGVHILEQVELPGNIKEIILHHHERYDGNGYPDGTDKDTTSLEAFILGVADAYDAMTSDRSYRRGMPQEEAIRILEENKGGQFHPQVVDAFVGVLRKQAAARAAELQRQEAGSKQRERQKEAVC